MQNNMNRLASVPDIPAEQFTKRPHDNRSTENSKAVYLGEPVRLPQSIATPGVYQRMRHRRSSRHHDG